MPTLDFGPIVFVVFLLQPESHRPTCQARKESDLGVVAVVCVGAVDETAAKSEFAGAGAAVVEEPEHERA